MRLLNLRIDNGRIVVPEGLRVDSNFELKYTQLNSESQRVIEYSGGHILNELATIDDNSGTAKDNYGQIIIHSNIFPVSNYQHEVSVNDAKRRIRTIRPTYSKSVVSDLQRAMKYKKSSQYVNKS